MKVLMLTYGTRGDIQPFVALAWALKLAGHKPVLGAPAGAASLAKEYDVPFIAFADPYEAAWAREAVVANSGLPRRMRQFVTNGIRGTRPLIARLLDDMSRTSSTSTDVVVHHAAIPGHEIAELLGVPAVPVCLQPSWIPTKAFPDPRIPFRVPRFANRASYFWTKLEMMAAVGRTSRWRRETLRLPRRHGHRNAFRKPDGTPATVLQAFSKHVMPAEADYREEVYTTGFWLLPASPKWAPSPELAHFLESGDPPVYLGFGSMAGANSRDVGRIVLDAVRQAGVRAVVVNGWGGVNSESTNPNMFQIEQVPFDWLFPRMSAIIHHGGSGTTGMALASGRPQIVFPFVFDQRFYAERMHSLGVAPTRFDHRNLTSSRLAHAINLTVKDDRLAERAKQLGDQIRSEAGVHNAVSILESIG